MKKRIAILGATSHIAKGLIYCFDKDQSSGLDLYARNTDSVQHFVADHCSRDHNIFHINSFGENKYDAIINCIGVGTPKHAETMGGNILLVNERFDNMCLDYLESNSDCRYIYLSSGAVYGKNFSTPVDENYLNCININTIGAEDFYTISKINSEAKHRMLSHLNIIDLRVFSYFSRFVDIDAGYLITEMMKCVRDRKEFVTNSENIIRDYTVPEELARLVKICLLSNTKNGAIDVRSKKPVSKFELMGFFEERYKMRSKVIEEYSIKNMSGNKLNYYSNNRNAEDFGYYPISESIQSIDSEIMTMHFLRNDC